MGIFSKLVGGGFSLAGRTAMFAPTMTGAFVGGVWGGLSSNSNTGTGRAGDVFAGALAGAGIGAAGKLAWRAGKYAVNHPFKTIGAAGKVGLTGASLGMKGLGMINRHYLLAGGIGLGAAGLAMASDGENNMSAAQMGARAQQMGVPSTGFEPGMGGNRQALIESTVGLTQGLHRGRHR